MAADVTGAAVLLTAADCAKIDRALRLGLAELAARNGGTSGGVEQVAALVHAVASEYRAAHLRRSDPVSAQPSVPGVEVGPECSVSAAAAVVGLAESTVRRLVGDGTLAGRRTPRGTWAIDTAALAEFMQQRAAQRAA